MNHNMYAVFDTSAKTYSGPFLAVNDDTARRHFATAVNSEGHSYNMYPEDFTLMVLGEFNDNSGLINSFTPTKICNALECIRKKSVDNGELFG